MNRKVTTIAQYFKRHPFYGLTNIVPAYASVAFCFDVYAIHQALPEVPVVFDWVRKQVALPLQSLEVIDSVASTLVMIPMCFDTDLGNDLVPITAATGLSKNEIIDLYINTTYYVYMLGFLPGFAYMGQVHKKLAIPRKANPEKVKAGAVAITGSQTGIYPVTSFGGWHVLGYSPLKMFDSHRRSPCYLQAGQEVRFVPISLDAYLNWKP